MSKFGSMALAVDEARRMTILHPTSRQPLRDDDGNEAYIDIYSADSNVARSHQRELSRRRLNARGAKITPEQLEAEGTDLLVALTKGWNLMTLKGQPLDVEFTEANARELYDERSMAWLREQVDAFAADRGNFTDASSEN